MSASNANSGYFQLKVNDTELPQSRNLFKKAILQCGYGLAVPVAMFEFDDSNNILVGDLAIIDGTRLSVSLGNTIEDSVEYTFLCISTDEDPLMSSTEIVVYCILDCPSLSTESAMDVFANTTSIDAMKQLAGKVGLKYDPPDVSTSDNMTWINSGKTRAQFFKDITEYAYVSDSDALTTLVDFDTVRTRSAIETLKADPDFNLYHQTNPSNDPKAIVVDELKPESRSGILNISNGYGHFHYQPSASGTDLEYTSISPSVQGKGLNINADVKAAIAKSKLTAGRFFDAGGAELESGNVHKNYYKAPYVYTRIMSLFNTCIRVSTPTFNNLDLFTPIDLLASSVKDDITDSSRYSGKYLIGGKTLYLEPNYYFEAYDCYRSYLTVTGNTKPVAGSADTEAGFAPESDSDTLNPVVISNTAGTGNKIDSKVPDADKPKALSEQLKAKYGIGNSTPTVVSDAVAKMDKLATQLDEQFKAAGEALGFEELTNKWGSASDKLVALGSEFQAAKAKLDSCKDLNKIQLLSIEAIKLTAPAMLSMIADRMNSINSTLALMDSILRDAGILDMTDPEDPSTTIECGPKLQQAMNKATKGIFDDACLDDRAFKIAQLPRLDLMDKLRKLERMYEDLLCTAMEKVTEGI